MNEALRSGGEGWGGFLPWNLNEFFLVFWLKGCMRWLAKLDLNEGKSINKKKFRYNIISRDTVIYGYH